MWPFGPLVFLNSFTSYSHLFYLRKDIWSVILLILCIINKCSFRISIIHSHSVIIIPLVNKVMLGYTGFTMAVCPSVCLSIRLSLNLSLRKWFPHDISISFGHQ